MIGFWIGLVSYNGLLLYNPGCNPDCLGYSARGQQSHQNRLLTQSDWCPRTLFSRPGSSVARAGLGKPNRVNVTGGATCEPQIMCGSNKTVFSILFIQSS